MSLSPAVLAIGTALPAHRYAQEEIYELAARYSAFYRTERVRQIFMNSDIDFRHLSFDINEFNPGESLDDLHRRFHDNSILIGSEAIRRCLASGGYTGDTVDCIVVVSCTGYLCPGLTSILSKELDLRKDIQRADLLGMGCAGAMPGLQRAYDFVKAYPDKKALLLAVEICTACYYLDDGLETAVGNAICGDGAAAVLIGMSEEPSVPKIRGFATHLEPALLSAVGFEQREGRLRINLSKDIRVLAGDLSQTVLNELLAKHHLTKDEITHWVIHSGGRKVIDNIVKVLNLSDTQLAHSKHVLRHYGNMSSPTVLFVLQETMARSRPHAGEHGFMLALGPGLAAEGAILDW
ncbi:MAG TPA: type III polyketide synthase [Bacteroidota bacterium]|nr:type III polyketide synthase [Bacteroidota bacterium]